MTEDEPENVREILQHFQILVADGWRERTWWGKLWYPLCLLMGFLAAVTVGTMLFIYFLPEILTHVAVRIGALWDRYTPSTYKDG